MTSVELPWPVLTRILQLVALQQRLSSCALVCKSWAAAAVAATSSISFSTPKSWGQDSSKAGFRKWLQQHGQVVHSLELTLTGDASHLMFTQDTKDEDTVSSSSSDHPSLPDDDENVIAIRWLDHGIGAERTVLKDTSCFKLPILQLQHLTSLSLDGVSLPSLSPHSQPQQQQQGASGSDNASHSSSSGNAALLPQLVALKLVQCRVAGQAELQQLVCATGLTKLHVDRLSVPDETPIPDWLLQQDWDQDRDRDAERRVRVTASAVGHALHLCSSLVSLKLVIVHEKLDRHAPSPLASLSCLLKLQELDIDIPSDASADFLPPLSTSISRLSLCAISSDGMPAVQAALQQIPSLQHLWSLSLDSIGIDAATFGSMTHIRYLQLAAATFDVKGLGLMTRLQQLVLDDCRMYKRVHAGGLYPFGTADRLRSADAESVLLAIGHLTQLQVLEVASRTNGNGGRHAYDIDTVGFALQDAPESAFSALTASGQLQQLRLHGFAYSSIPRGAVAHMLPVGRQLTQLTALELSSRLLDVSRSAWCWSLTAADLQSISSSCPCLRALHMQGLVEPGADLSSLLQLRQCRDLSVGGRAFGDHAVEVVAQMTQLTSLSWYCSTGFSSVGLNQLTALTNLQQLVLVPVFKPEEKTQGHTYFDKLYKQDVEEVETDIWAMLDGRRKVLTDQGALVSAPTMLLNMYQCTVN